MSRICDRCGHENPDWCSFCRYCGTALVPNEVETAVAELLRPVTGERPVTPAPRHSRGLPNPREGYQDEVKPEFALTREEIKQAVREVLREEQLVRGVSLKAVMLTVILSMIIGVGLLFGSWKLYEKFIIDVEKAELHASARTAEIVNDLRGLKSACLLYHTEHVGVSSGDVTSVAIESLVPYLVTPLTNDQARIVVQAQAWFIEYPVDNDARVRTALRERAGELGLTRNTQGAAYNGGDVIYVLGRR